MSDADLLDQAASSPRSLTHSQIVRVLQWPDVDELYAAAYAVKSRCVGTRVAMRALVEFSNVCAKDCYYCGIRRSNSDVRRYTMSAEEIVAAARWAFESGYGSVVLQSGERSDASFIDFVDGVLRGIHDFAGDGFGVTASLGEQSEQTYARWREAGAHRYLLRIETSNRDLYARLHPADHSWDRRLECLRTLRRLGYCTGSGVMCALPGQTSDDLASDIEFYAREDFDMIGMGPYIPHPGTPLGVRTGALSAGEKKHRLELALRMIAATRLYLHDVNIAAATSLQALDPEGREKGLLAGANVIMPNATASGYRRDYTLYAGKPCLDEDAAACRGCIERRVASIGETVVKGERGDPPHFAKRHLV